MTTSYLGLPSRIGDVKFVERTDHLCIRAHGINKLSTVSSGDIGERKTTNRTATDMVVCLVSCLAFVCFFSSEKCLLSSLLSVMLTRLPSPIWETELSVCDFLTLFLSDEGGSAHLSCFSGYLQNSSR